MYPVEYTLQLGMKDRWCHSSISPFSETHGADHLDQCRTDFSFMDQGVHLSWAHLCHPVTSHTAPWNKTPFQLGYSFPSMQHLVPSVHFHVLIQPQIFMCLLTSSLSFYISINFTTYLPVFAFSASSQAFISRLLQSCWLCLYIQLKHFHLRL